MMRASSGGARSSSAVIALTVPAVPTGMNTGVGISPRGVWRMPARAWPSVAMTSNSMVEQHRIAVAEEAIALGDRVAVRREHAIGAGERAHQHEQRRFREVEVGDEVVDDAKLVARIDEQIRRALAGRPAARLERAQRGGAERDDRPARAHELGGALGDRVALAMHAVLAD